MKHYITICRHREPLKMAWRSTSLWIASLTLAMTILFSISAHAADKSAYDRVMRTGVIKCGYGISPPAMMKDPNTGKLSGFDHDVWETLAKNLDLKIEWVESGGWGTFIEDLKTGRYDAFCSQVWPTPSRVKFLSLTQPVAYYFVNAYVRPDDARFKIGQVENLNSDKIIIPVLDGDISEDMAKIGFPKAQRLALPNNANWGDLYLSVTGKKADVMFTEPTSYDTIAASNPVKLKKINTAPVFTFAGYYSFEKSDAALRDMIEVTLQGLIDSGQLATMLKAALPNATAPDKNYTRK